MSAGNEIAVFFTQAQREAVLRGVFTSYYDALDPSRTAFDTNRGWTTRLELLAELFPHAKMICCVRPILWIIDSVERLVRRNAFELSKIFDFDTSGNVYTRAAERGVELGRVENDVVEVVVEWRDAGEGLDRRDRVRRPLHQRVVRQQHDARRLGRGVACFIAARGKPTSPLIMPARQGCTTCVGRFGARTARRSFRRTSGSSGRAPASGATSLLQAPGRGAGRQVNLPQI